MKELAERSGVSAGTIKHYLREGLLPEPVKTSRNMAYYPPEFVERIRLIKQLQEERFMPLKLIRSVLDEDPERARALVELEDRILERALQGDTQPRDRPRSCGAATTSRRRCSSDWPSSRSSRPNSRGYGERDVQIVEAISRFRAGGYDERIGFTVYDTVRYKRALEDLVKEEVQVLMDRLAGELEPDRAAELIQAGVEPLRDLIARAPPEAAAWPSSAGSAPPAAEVATCTPSRRGCAGRPSGATGSARRSTASCCGAPATTPRRAARWPRCSPGTRTTRSSRCSSCASWGRCIAWRWPGSAPELAAVYPSCGGDGAVSAAWEAFRATVAANLEELDGLVRRPVQTNEVGRSRALALGLPAGSLPRRGCRCGCSSSGSSAGLNLRWDAFRYASGGFEFGDPASPVQFLDYAEGALPSLPAARTDRGAFGLRRGAGGSRRRRSPHAALIPVARPAGPAARARRRPRGGRRDPGLGGALGRGGLAGAPAGRARPGACTVVFHSIVMQYVDAERSASGSAS